MTIKTLTVMVAAGLLAAGVALAQQAPGPCGNGYGGPPKSPEERAARQAVCQEKNGGVCPQGGPRENCPGPGMGAGKGQRKGAGMGQGYRHRAGHGACPQPGGKDCPSKPAPAQK